MIVRYLKSPFSRISMGICLLTLSIVLFSDVFGFFPNQHAADFAKRKVLSETVAVQVSQGLSTNNELMVHTTLERFVTENKTVMSIAIYNDKKQRLFTSGDHDTHWKESIAKKSTPSNVIVPIYKDDDTWGEVQISFTELKSGLFAGKGSLLTFALFLIPFCYLGYTLFLRRVLKELNPDAVIPQRVSLALDTLAEGLLIIDPKGNIVFSNKAFHEITKTESNFLIGKNINTLSWKFPETENTQKEYIWDMVFYGHKLPEEYKLVYQTMDGKLLTFELNASAVMTDSKNIRGVLITFDDITLLEKRNLELENALERIQNNQKEIERQNEELMFLATHDPLTNLLNRRSFFENANSLLQESVELDKSSCIAMADIDFFKKINDEHGHNIGDRVIRNIAQILKDSVTSDALVGRYGGEEFCVLLPNTSLAKGASLMESIREIISNHQIITDEATISITASFGICQTSDNTNDLDHLLDSADKALYSAKESGRNKVMIWKGTDLEPIEFDKSQKIELESTEGISNDLETGNNSEDELHDSLNNNNSEIDQKSTESNQITGSLPDKLISRLVVLDRIEHAIKYCKRHHTSVAVLALRMSDANRVNSLHGIRAAEHFMLNAMKRLETVLRESDSVLYGASSNMKEANLSRINADEFIIVLTDLNNESTITVVLNRIYDAMQKPVTVGESQFHCNANIGIAFASHDKSDPERLLAHASTALSEANSSGNINAFEFYNEEIRSKLKHKIRLEADLRNAIDNDELFLVYQPQIDLNTGNLRGVETLIRWNHREIGLIPPNEFIPLAEQCGIMNDISLWVLRNACAQQNIWNTKGAGIIPIAINIAAPDLENPDFVDHTLSILEAQSVDPTTIELEITEGTLIKKLESSLNSMSRFRKAGLKLAIDDFGVGYSSLSYIKRFPVNTLKIDKTFIQSFLEDADDSAIVSAIISMSHSLDLTVIAEGIETIDQLRFLQELDCDVAQGYHTGKPMSANEILNYLARSGSMRNEILSHSRTLKSGFEIEGLVGSLKDVS